MDFRSLQRVLDGGPGHRWARVLAVLLVLLTGSSPAIADPKTEQLDHIFADRPLVVLADVKHGVRDRIEFFSSGALFESLARSSVRHLAIEMPRVLGRQAMSIETEDDVEKFAQDLLRSDQWHFIDPDHPDEEQAETQHRVAAALGRQVLLAKKFGINLIFYDFINPLGGFSTYNDPVYRCIAELSNGVWLRYGLNGQVTKSQRDAAIMRERLSHDDELAAYIEQRVQSTGGGKVVVIPGYAHAALPEGIAERLSQRLQARATVVAVFKDRGEDDAFHTFLWQQARLLGIDLSRPPDFYYEIAEGSLRADSAPGRYLALDASRERDVPMVCMQMAHAR